MSSFRKNTVLRFAAVFLSAAFAVASVGCNTSGGSKNPLSVFQSNAKKTQKPVEKTGPRTMAEFMAIPRDDRW